MKKALSLLATGFIITVLLSTCDKPCTEYLNTKMNDLRAMLYNWETGAPAEGLVSTGNLRLKLDFSLSFIMPVKHYSNAMNFFPAAYAVADCVSANIGLKDKIESVSLVCDKPVGGFDAGENLISGMSLRGQSPKTFIWSIDEWMDVFNTGYDPKRFLIYLNTHEGNYEFYVMTLLSGAEVEEDDYTFTFRLDYASSANSFVVTLPPVRLE